MKTANDATPNTAHLEYLQPDLIALDDPLIVWGKAWSISSETNQPTGEPWPKDAR